MVDADRVTENVEDAAHAVSGLQKVYMRKWDDAQEAVDKVKSIPIRDEFDALVSCIKDVIDTLVSADFSLSNRHARINLDWKPNTVLLIIPPLKG